MNAKQIGALFGLVLGIITPAKADYVISTPTVAPPSASLQTVFSGSVGGKILNYHSPVDASGNPFGTASNPLAFTFGTGVLLPQFASPAHFICDSGCSGGGGGGGSVFGPTPSGSAAANPPILLGGTSDGTATGTVGNLKVVGGLAFINCANCSGSGISVGFGSSIGSVGTPNGYKDASGNFQPILGDVTNGQWVSIKASTTVPVSGTFWQATQPISGNVGITGTLPAFAATPTFNIGTAPTIAVTGTFFQATQPVSATSLPLPTGAATQATLASLLSALGTPFQAGGSIGNTSFGISGTLPAFAATPTFNVGTIAGIATATNQTGGGQKTQIVDSSGNVIASTSNNLNVQCANCSGSGVSTADGATFTAGSSLFAGAGGIFQTTATSNLVTNGHQGLFQMTAQRALFTNLRDSSGNELGLSSAPLQVSLANTGANGTPIAVGSSTLATAANQATTNTALGTPADAPCTLPATTTACSQIAINKAVANTANSPATLASQYPSGAVPITASATGTTAATTATLPGTSGKTTFVCGYSIRANATANANVTNTLTGVISGTMSSAMWVPANTAGLGVDEQIFNPCIPASAPNTGIAAVSGAAGTGGVVTSKIWGYQL